MMTTTVASNFLNSRPVGSRQQARGRISSKDYKLNNSNQKGTQRIRSQTLINIQYGKMTKNERKAPYK